MECLQFGGKKDAMNIILLIGLFLNNHYISLIDVNGGDTTTTNLSGYANVSSWSGGTYIYAHNYLAGAEFYDLEIGETIIAFYSDGSTKEFQVANHDEFSFGNPDDELALRVNYQWMDIDSVVKLYSSPDTLTLATCFPAQGQMTGRLYIRLEELPSDNSIKQWQVGFADIRRMSLHVR